MLVKLKDDWASYGWFSTPGNARPPHIPQRLDPSAFWFYHGHTNKRLRQRGMFRVLIRELLLEAYRRNPSPEIVVDVEESNHQSRRAVSEAGAALGIAHDGDADRMMAVDDRGRFIPGDKLLAIFARESGAQEVVTTLDASMAIEEMGFAVSRTKIGDTAVSEELRDGGDFGGETSGSWVFPGISLCPDGIYAAARMV